MILSFTAWELQILQLPVVMVVRPDNKETVSVYCPEIHDFKTLSTMVLMTIF